MTNTNPAYGGYVPMPGATPNMAPNAANESTFKIIYFILVGASALFGPIYSIVSFYNGPYGVLAVHLCFMLTVGALSGFSVLAQKKTMLLWVYPTIALYNIFITLQNVLFYNRYPTADFYIAFIFLGTGIGAAILQHKIVAEERDQRPLLVLASLGVLTTIGFDSSLTYITATAGVLSPSQRLVDFSLSPITSDFFNGINAANITVLAILVIALQSFDFKVDLAKMPILISFIGGLYLLTQISISNYRIYVNNLFAKPGDAVLGQPSPLIFSTIGYLFTFIVVIAVAVGLSWTGSVRQYWAAPKPVSLSLIREAAKKLSANSYQGVPAQYGQGQPGGTIPLAPTGQAQPSAPQPAAPQGAVSATQPAYLAPQHGASQHGVPQYNAPTGTMPPAVPGGINPNGTASQAGKKSTVSPFAPPQ